MKHELTYQKALAELQAIHKALEENKVPVEELIAKVQRANELVKWCQDKLTTTEKALKNIDDTSLE